MRDTRYHTSWLRVLTALLVGAFLGAAIVVANYLYWLWTANGPAHFAEWALSKGLRIAIPAFVIWLTGILTFGGPVWLILHHLKMRHWINAVIAGWFIPFVVLLIWQTDMLTGASRYRSTVWTSEGTLRVDGVMTDLGWQLALQGAAQFAILGVCVALAIWRVAYRRKDPKTPQLGLR